MMREETIDRVISYVSKMSGIDPGLVKETMTIFHLHRELEMLAEAYTSKRYGFSMRQFETLEAIFHKKDQALTPAQLAEEVHLTRSAMTGNLDSLEKKGYLARGPHPDDRRKLVITLTKRGKNFCNRTLPDKYQDLAKVVKGLSPEMRNMSKDIYKRIIENIEKMIKEVNN